MPFFSRHIALFVLIPLVLVAHLRFTFVEWGFAVAQEWIAENLCENRQKPEVGCGGACVLSKSMALADEQSEEAESNSPTVQFNLYYGPAHAEALSFSAISFFPFSKPTHVAQALLVGIAFSPPSPPPRLLA